MEVIHNASILLRDSMMELVDNDVVKAVQRKPALVEVTRVFECGNRGKKDKLASARIIAIKETVGIWATHPLECLWVVSTGILPHPSSSRQPVVARNSRNDCFVKSMK